jgi:hypothetical protein
MRARVQLHRRGLDAMLSSGAARHESAELALRARQLTSRRRRLALADSIDEVIEVVERRGLRLNAIPPLAREVRATRPVLRELEMALRSDDEVEPAGILLVQRLLTNGIGPLYFDCGHDALWRAVKDAIAALGGRVPQHTGTALPG